MNDAKKCRTCSTTVRDTPALKRHCSEAHEQDIDGNPIFVERFQCPVMTCPKHIVPFKRQDKLANHIRASHFETNEGQEVNSGILSGEKHAALITNDTVEGGNDFGRYREVARVSTQAQYGSAEADIRDDAVLNDFLFPLRELQSAPVANASGTALSYVRIKVPQLWKMLPANVLRLHVYRDMSIFNLALLPKGATRT
jgi:hypothetical protein